MSAYYNENDKSTAAWLRELVKEGLIADGEVDDRSIADVLPADLAGFAQCHFFAGIGGWSYALRLAGWPDTQPVWTGSCPCQPFSSAGAQVGGDDPRHLWPAWFRLISECRPPVLFGEQVAAAIGHGWLDLVFGDLEGSDYACGAAVLGAHSVGAPHIRQRVWFVADTGESEQRRLSGQEWSQVSETWSGGANGELAESNGGRQRERTEQHSREASHSTDRDSCREYPDGCSGSCELGDANSSERWPQAEGRHDEHDRPDAGRQEAASGQRLSRESSDRAVDDASQRECQRAESCAGGRIESEHGCKSNPWTDIEWLPCRDGKARPTQPGLQPLAHGISERVAILRGAGNAIVPQVAQAFIEAYLSLHHA